MNPLIKLFNHYDKIVCLDTETTGLSYKNNRIIEIGAVAYILVDGQIKENETLSELISLPIGEKLKEEITKLTGITDEDLETYGIYESQVAKRLWNMLQTPNGHGRVLFIAYNAMFDMAFVREMFRRYLLEIEDLPIDYLDALTVYRDRAPYPHKLKDAITYFHLEDEVVNSHRATDDARAAWAVLEALAMAKNDIEEYINLFGYNPRYAPMAEFRIVRSWPQEIPALRPLYEKIG